MHRIIKSVQLCLNRSGVNYNGRRCVMVYLDGVRWIIHRGIQSGLERDLRGKSTFRTR